MFVMAKYGVLFEVRNEYLNIIYIVRRVSASNESPVTVSVPFIFKFYFNIIPHLLSDVPRGVVASRFLITTLPVKQNKSQCAGIV
jgi:hypothetical protein